jgi:predicted aspartyl protease
LIRQILIHKLESIEEAMQLRQFLLALASLTTFASYANDVPPTLPETTASIPDEVIVPEEVVVAAPEPRYVAPTLRDRIGRVWAPVYINGHGPFRLVLDTGANGSAVIHSVVERIGAPVQANAMRLLGATGTGIVPTIQAYSIEVGDLSLGNRKLAVVENVFGGAEGVLGVDGFSDKRISIDFRNDQISIRRSGAKAPHSGFTRVPLRVRHGHLLMFEVKLAGVRTKAMLDTGAQRTIGNTALREALARRARQGKASDIIGVTMDVQQGETFAAPPVMIKDIAITGMQVTFGDLYIFEHWKMTHEPMLIIGMDIIGVLDSLVIDYKHREMHLRTRR